MLGCVDLIYSKFPLEMFIVVINKLYYFIQILLLSYRIILLLLES